MARQSRTWLCSVVFLDIVAFSKRPVSGQLEVKQHLTRLIADALEEVPENDTILLDSGDGAAVCFLADPVEALFFALGLHSALGKKDSDDPEYSCRIGVNLGPVKVIKDVTGRRNTVGDGINSAQRVMDFAEPGQLLVSRSFHDVVACLSEEYQQLFSYIGIRRDKHVKEYDIYEVKPPSQSIAELLQDESGEDYASSTGEPAPLFLPPKDSAPPPPQWNAAQLEQIGHDLAERIGPVAKVLVQRASARATTLQELYEMLAARLPDEDMREDFLRSHQDTGQPASTKTPPTDSEPKPPSSAPVTPTQSASPEPPNLELSNAVYEKLRHRLAESQGPFAKVLIKRALKQAGAYPELCRLLADNLPQDQRDGFIAFALKVQKSHG